MANYWRRLTRGWYARQGSNLRPTDSKCVPCPTLRCTTLPKKTREHTPQHGSPVRLYLSRFGLDSRTGDGQPSSLYSEDVLRMAVTDVLVGSDST